MIDPRYMTAVEWTDRIAGLLPFTVPRLYNEMEWKNWARSLLLNPTISNNDVPDPEDFDDWQQWAERFNQAVEL